MKQYKLQQILNVLLIGNALKVLRKIPSKSVRTIVTSPPYYGLRDYDTSAWIGGNDFSCNHIAASDYVADAANSSTLKGTTKHQQETHRCRKTYRVKCEKCGAVRVDEQIGLEKTPELYIRKLVKIFRECRRVLKDDGTMWIVIGDSYWGGKGASGSITPDEQKERLKYKKSIQKPSQTIGADGYTRPTDRKHPTIKPKDLVGIPWMLAFALRKDGWYLRQDIIWSKPNPMPESVTDRCAKAHEYIFLFSKSHKYYFDYFSIKQPAVISEGNSSRKSGNIKRKPSTERGVPEGTGKNQSSSVPWEGEKANKKSVWTVPTQPFKGAHFATFPENLISDCIKAGASEYGQCACCGMPWQRIILKNNVKNTGKTNTKYDSLSSAGRLAKKRDASRQQHGKEFFDDGVTEKWIPSCECNGKLIEKLVKRGKVPVYDQQTDEISGYEDNYEKIIEYISDIELKDHPVQKDVCMDIFSGAATTFIVAQKLGFDAIGIDLSQKYIEDISIPRIKKEMGMFFNAKVINGK